MVGFSFSLYNKRVVLPSKFSTLPFKSEIALTSALDIKPDLELVASGNVTSSDFSNLVFKLTKSFLIAR